MIAVQGTTMNFWQTLQRAGVLVLVVTCASWAARPQLSDVISIQDLETEIQAELTEIEHALESPNSFQAGKGRLRLVAGQLAVFSQVLAEHPGDSKWKAAGPAIRDAAIHLGRFASFEDAQAGLQQLKESAAGKNELQSPVEFEWTKLARVRLLMEILRDRTDQVRKSLRRSKDPETESRQASAMAMIGLAVSAHVPAGASPEDAATWGDWSLEFQRNMTEVASALRRQERAVALEQFTAAQAVCTKCHDRFKP